MAESRENPMEMRSSLRTEYPDPPSPTLPGRPPRFYEQQLVDTVTGLVSSLETHFPAPGEPPLYTAYTRMANYLYYSEVPHGPNGGSGAGLHEEHARMAALCESVERYCLIPGNPQELVVGSYTEMAPRFDLLSPEACPLFHPGQFPAVGYARFDRQTLLSWTWACSLTRQKPILVPAVFVYLHYPLATGETAFCRPISTGAACGTSYGDAIVRGIYEIVERDAFMILWLNRHSAPRLKIPPQSRLGQSIQRRFHSPAMSHTLIWMSSDLPIHACLAIVVEEAQGMRRSYVGLSAHLDPQRAALGALVEADEVRRGIPRVKESAKVLNDPAEITSIHQHGYYYAQADRTSLLDFLLHTPQEIKLEDLEDASQGSPAANLQTCLEICARAGIEVIVADVTKEDVRQAGLRVVRVVMPGMVPLTNDHNRPFLGSPRLYEVPVRLGWQGQPRGYTEFNPDPHPFV